MTGSVRGCNYDKYSDIDLFLIASQKNQKKFKLKPIYIYKYCGLEIEISMFTKEKVINDSMFKSNIFRWKNTDIYKVFNKSLLKTLHNASRLTKEEKLNLLWTNYVSIKINQYDIEKQIKRNDVLSIRMLTDKNLILFLNMVLMDKDIFVNLKQVSFSVKKINNNLYNKVFNLIDNPTKLNNLILKEIVKILVKNRFKKEEIDNWDKVNLTRVMFQYK